MVFKHTFNVELSWMKETAPGVRRYAKTHQITVTGKPTLEVSAAKPFKGDPSLHNPEDLLLSSLISCHMMSYLYVCSQHGIDVLSYSDQGRAILETNADGSGKIVEVVLTPKVIISNPDGVALALKLHQEANKLCFIANSCNFKISHEPTCQSLKETIT